MFFSVIIGMLLVHEGFVGISAEDRAAQEAAFEALKATYDQGSGKTLVPGTGGPQPIPGLVPLTGQTGNLGLNNPEAVAYASGLQQSLYIDSARSEMPTTRALSQGSSYLANMQTKGYSPPVPTTVPIVYGCPKSSCPKSSCPKSSCDEEDEENKDPVAVKVGGYPFSTGDKDTCIKCCD